MNDIQTWLDNSRPDFARNAREFCYDTTYKGTLERIEPTALRALLSVALEATCFEEFEIVVRYQQGRDRKKWPEAFVTPMLNRITECTKLVANKHALPVELRDKANAMAAAAWLGNVIKLHRLFYEVAREQNREQGGRR